MRNPKIAGVFHETNVAETKGSGIRTMKRLMEDAGFAPPTFESDRGSDLFTARLLLHHFLTPEDITWLLQLNVPDLTDSQKRVLVFIRELGAIDNQTYRQLNALDSLAASTELRRLRDLGLLDKKGKSTATYYIPGPNLLPYMEIQPEYPTTETHNLQPETHKLRVETHKLQALPEELISRLNGLGARPGREVRKELILLLCHYAEWSTGELAELLKIKDPLYLQREYIKPLLKDRKLQPKFPDMINHPKQAYKLGPVAKVGE